MKQGKRLITIMVSLVISAAVVALLIFSASRLIPEPPDEEVNAAISALGEASSRKASLYSRRLLREAEDALDSAMTAWRRENRRFIFLRDYDRVILYAREAAEKGIKAAATSEYSSRTLHDRIEIQINEAEKVNSRIDRLFGRYPLREDQRLRLAKGRLLLREAEAAFQKSDLLSANRKITEAEYLLNEVYSTAMEDLRSYFGSYPRWKSWAESSIAESSGKKTLLILVDKTAGKCYIYSAGRIRYEFDAEFGKNWAGEKKKMGDKATPEGRYHVTRKYQGRETRYHKAIAISYPNNEDKERFKTEIAKGILAPGTKIGSGIEIHGGGGKGADWTDGCVALSDRDIDLLYPLVNTGTPVTIVGSLKTIEEVIAGEDE